MLLILGVSRQIAYATNAKKVLISAEYKGKSSIDIAQPVISFDPVKYCNGGFTKLRKLHSGKRRGHSPNFESSLPTAFELSGLLSTELTSMSETVSPTSTENVVKRSRGGRHRIFTVEQRKDRNRRAQAAFRERRSRYTHTLEQTVVELESIIRELQV